MLWKQSDNENPEAVQPKTRMPINHSYRLISLFEQQTGDRAPQINEQAE